MIIKDLRSSVDFAGGTSQHVMVVGLDVHSSVISVPIDALTYAQLVSAYEQLVLESRASYQQEPPPATVEDVRQLAESHIGHVLAPRPLPEDEAEAEAQLRMLEQQHSAQSNDAEELLRSVGFMAESVESNVVPLIQEEEEDDRGEENDLFVEDDDGVEAY